MGKEAVFELLGSLRSPHGPHGQVSRLKGAPTLLLFSRTVLGHEDLPAMANFRIQK